MAPTSRIDFTPAHTTSTGVRDSVVRSADSSQRVARAAVHAAEPAGGEDPDAGARRRGARSRRRSWRRPRRAAATTAMSRTLTFVDVGVAGHPLEGGVVEPDPGLAVDDGDRRRHRAAVAHRGLDLAGDAQVVRAGQAVADDRALQRDDGLAGRECRRDLGVDEQRVAHVRVSFARRVSRPTGTVTDRGHGEGDQGRAHPRLRGEVQPVVEPRPLPRPPAEVAGIDQLVGDEPEPARARPSTSARGADSPRSHVRREMTK